MIKIIIKRSLMLLVLLPFLSTCSDNPLSSSDFTKARVKWESLGFDSYSFNYRQSCFCAWGGVTFRVTVIGNSVVNAVDTSGIVMVDSSDYNNLYTIDQLFNYLDNALKKNPAELDYNFHPQLGYPEHFFVDYSKQIADDEFAFKVDSLIGLR